MTLISLLSRNLLNVAVAAGVVSAAAAGFYLKDPETLISDSFGRAMELETTAVQTKWLAPQLGEVTLAANDIGEQMQLKRQVFRSITQPATSMEPVADSDLLFARAAPAPMPGSFAVGDRITVDSNGYIAASYKIISIESMHDDVTRVDTSLRSSRLLLVTASESINGEEKVIRFVIAATAKPTIVSQRDADQTL